MTPIRMIRFPYLLPIALIVLLSGFQLSLFSQTNQPGSNIRQWEKLSTEHFEIIFPAKHEGGAIQTARFAELARYELGVILDYKPEQKFTLLYADDAETFLNSNIPLQSPNKTPSIFDLPERYSLVVHPGSTQELYQAVRRAVGEVVLTEFSFGDRITATMQTKLLLYDAPWFHQGLAEYMATGWTFEDEMWINSLEVEDMLELAMEGNTPLHHRVRKSVWHYITHEYGEQKISEIVYLVNISHSIESGIISVLGINLNTLTRRWRDFLSLRAEQQRAQRVNILEIAQATEVPIPAGQQLVSYAYDPAKEIVAVHLNKRGRSQVMLYDLAEREYRSTPIKFGFQQPGAEKFEYSAPMAWDTTKQVLVAVVYRNREPELAYFDEPSGSLSYAKVSKGVHKLLSVAPSPDGNRVAVSALKDGKVDLFLTPMGKGQLKPLTNDPYDDLDPSWTVEGSLLFSSNRDTLLQEPHALPSYWYRRHTDVYELILGEEQLLMNRLTQTPMISERQPSIGPDGFLTFLTDEVGINNLGKLHLSRGGREVFSNLTQGILSYRQMDRFSALHIPLEGGSSLFVGPSMSFRSQAEPQPTLLRMEYLAAYETLMKKEQQALSQGKPDPIEPEIAESEVPEEEPEAEEVSEAEPPRYYLFDDEEISYQSPVKKKTSALSFEEPSERVMITVFGRQPAPKPNEVEVSRAQTAKLPWMVHQVGMNLNFDPLARIGPELSIGLRDLGDNHRLALTVWPSFNLRNVRNTLEYQYRKERINFFAEAGQQIRRVQGVNNLIGDTTFFRYDRIHLKTGAAYPINAFGEAQLFAGLYQVNRRDLQLLRTELQNAADQLAQVGVRFEWDQVEEREGFAYKGVYGQAAVESFYSFAEKNIVLNRARIELKHYLETPGKLVIASRVASTIKQPPTIP
ncbi:MAG: hypothetical protein AAF399_05045 [Bacteroidota bacterium]